MNEYSIDYVKEGGSVYSFGIMANTPKQAIKKFLNGNDFNCLVIGISLHIIKNDSWKKLKLPK